MASELNILEIPPSAETLITLSEKARLRDDVARAEHLLIQAWLAYDADSEDDAKPAGESCQTEFALNAA